MKYLSQYIEQSQTQALNKAGAFFAFSDKQFEEQKKAGTRKPDYISMGMGLICPKDNARQLKIELDAGYRTGIEQDIKENGQDAIITRELANHEAYYTGDIQSTVDALSDYGFTTADILAVFKINNAKGQPLTA